MLAVLADHSSYRAFAASRRLVCAASAVASDLAFSARAWSCSASASADCCHASASACAGQAELAARVPRCRRLRAVAFEHLGLQLTPAHGPDLGLFVGDLQRPDRVLAQGFELGSGMRVEAHRLLRIGDPPRLPVRRGRASPPRVVFPQDRVGIRPGWRPEMAGQPRFGVRQRPLAEFPAPVIEPGGQLVRQRRSVLRRPLRPRHAVSLRRQLQALKAAVKDASDRPGAVHRTGGDPVDDLADVVPGQLGIPQLVLQHRPGVFPLVPPGFGWR